MCEAFDVSVVSHIVSNGALVSSAPMFAPSSRNCTPTTPMLSEASALTVTMPDTVAPPAGAVMVTVGGVVSAGGGEAGDELSAA